MTIETVSLCCEGRACNAGISAAEREEAYLPLTAYVGTEVREAAAKHARHTATETLRVTPHTLVGSDGRGQIYACEVCGHRRVFGGTQYTAYQGQSAAVSR